MSRPNPNSAEQSSKNRPDTPHYEVECCNVDDNTVQDVKELADNAGIRVENFEFKQSDDSATDIPCLRVKRLEQDTAESLIETLHKNGLMDIFDGNPIVTVLP